MDEALKSKIEAILFSIGRKISIDELMKMIKEKDKGKVVASLLELKKGYNDDQNKSLMILQDGDDWKLTIKDQYIDVAKEIGVETELKKSVMETLAVIAYKTPAMQSEIIKVRTNKAYDHLKELEELGYILREKHGRTKKIKLTEKFFEYFDLPPDSLKEKFNNVADMEKAIKDKEMRIHEINETKKEVLEERKIQEKKAEQVNIFIEGRERVKEILEHRSNGLEVIQGETYGKLQVYDEPVDETTKEEDKKNAKIETSNPEKLGDFDVFKEPDNFIEPGIEYEKEVRGNLSQKEELIDNDIGNLQEDKKSKSDDIAKMQERKDALNIGKSEDGETSDEKVSETSDMAANDGSKMSRNNTNNPGLDDIGDDIPKNEPRKKEDEKNKDIDKAPDDDMFGNRNHTDNPKNENETRAGQKSDSERLKVIAEMMDNKDEDNEKIEWNEDSVETAFERHKKNKEGENDSPEHVEILKEQKLFNMDGLSKDTLDKIEEKAEEITGEKKINEDNL